jgi:hypothetical protein
MNTATNPYGFYDSVEELEDIYDSFCCLIELSMKQHFHGDIAAFEENAGQAAARIRELLHL